MTVRSVVFLGILVSGVYFRGALLCERSHLLGGFMLACLAMILVTVLLEVGIVAFSARGTIVRTRPRKPIVWLLHSRVLLFVLEAALLAVGTGFALKTQTEEDRTICPNLDDAVLITQLTVAIVWCMFFVLVCLLLVYLDPCHCYSAKVNYSFVERRVRQRNVDRTVLEEHWRLTHSVWEKRFRVACCLAGSDDTHQVAYREVAEIFATYFCDLNVVLSDIAAGLVLLQREQLTRAEENESGDEEEGSAEETCETVPLDFNQGADREEFETALHFLRFSLAIYSWPLYVYMNPCCGLCRLCCRLQCCCRHGDRRPHVEHDNSCACYITGAQMVASVEEIDIIHASFENDLYRVPFFVCLDHERHAVVVSIRGTLSLHDIITDLTAKKPVECEACEGFLVHNGMLRTAEWVVQRLRDDSAGASILETAFSKVRDYRLVLVGHSLGAGCACLAGILLRSDYPGLHCYCYSPTGALLNAAAADYSREFTTSVTLGEDLIARLSVRSAHKLKEELVRLLESCNKPKCQILFEGLLETACKCFGVSLVFRTGHRQFVRQEDDVESGLASGANHRGGSDPEASLEFTPLLQRDLSTLTLRQSPPPPALVEAAGERGPLAEESHPLVRMFLPGRVIHVIDPRDTQVCFCAQRQLTAQWSPREAFGNVVVSPDMIRDHFPNSLLQAMEYVWKNEMEEIEERRTSSVLSDQNHSTPDSSYHRRLSS